MNVAGIDGHASYVVVTVLGSTAKMLQRPVRIKNDESHRLFELLAPHRPLEAVVETSPAWPWLHGPIPAGANRWLRGAFVRARVPL